MTQGLAYDVAHLLGTSVLLLSFALLFQRRLFGVLKAFALQAVVLALLAGGVALGLFEVSIAKMRVFRVAEFLGGALLLAVLATIFLYVARAL